MSPLDHEHPVSPERVAAARAGVLATGEAGRLAGLLGMLADPVRSRILFALSAAGELCVGDLALALEATEDQVSYALKMLRLAGMVSFRKDGRMMFYRLSDGFPKSKCESGTLLVGPHGVADLGARGLRDRIDEESQVHA